MAAGVGSNDRTILTDDGRPLDADFEPIGFGFFEVYGVKPLAGRLPSPSHGEDQYLTTVSPGSRYSLRPPANEVINASLARALGYPNPADAVGRSFRLQSAMNSSAFVRVTVIGVVPDAQFDLTRGPPKPAVYPVQPQFSGLLNVKLQKGRIPQTLAEIDRLWTTLGDPRPIQRQFTDAFLNTVYASTIRQGWLIATLGAIALGIANLGLFGLAAFVAENRAKEIGVRKVMGAAAPDILALLLWTFARPVLLANLIAWPVAGWAMTAWLRGFSAHIGLSPWMFLVASSAALAVALATVLGQTLVVAAAKPVTALRYE